MDDFVGEVELHLEAYDKRLLKEYWGDRIDQAAHECDFPCEPYNEYKAEIIKIMGKII
jgi:hypothetical protein